MKNKFILLSIFLSIIFDSTSAQKNVRKLLFHSEHGDIIIRDSSIFVNGDKLYHLKSDDIIYTSNRNKVIESSNSTFLFLEMDGNPNLNRLYVFKISERKVDSLINTISSEVRDYDEDTYLEFGGHDLTEEYISQDSMYYVPSDYYELRDGKILYDSAYTKKVNIIANGFYFTNPNKANGDCCKVIPKKK